MKNTKQKIIQAALKLFNSKGLVNVRLQHIADEAFVSVGNLAYHYANKEAIVLTLYQELAQAQLELLREFRIVPLFDYLDRLITLTFKLQQDYIFFYLDTLEILRAYPSVQEIHQQHIQHQIQQFKAIIDFNVARGVFKAEPTPGFYQQWAQQVWYGMDSWHTQQRVYSQETTSLVDYQSAIWALFIPFFTQQGQKEYEQMKQMRTTL